MKRREMLLTTGAALLGLSSFPVKWVAGAQKKTPKVLYFTRCAGFLHSVVRRNGEELSYSEKLIVEAGKQHGVEVVCSKDGRVFDGDLDQYDAIAFYTSGDLTKEVGEKTPPMTADGKKRLLDAVAAGKGFVAFHAGNDSFHSRGDQIDPYIAMVGGEFLTHGSQQSAKMRVTSPKFPGVENLGESFEMLEEWYALKNFAKDLHVILVQETAGMKDGCYQRPPFPATWARKHGEGRVFYTSMGHREDVWTNKVFQDVVLGGFSWVLKNCDADVTPNIEQVAPKANQLRND
jgi:type 1 glutamine amidotransferase